MTISAFKGIKGNNDERQVNLPSFTENKFPQLKSSEGHPSLILLPEEVQVSWYLSWSTFIPPGEVEQEAI